MKRGRLARENLKPAGLLSTNEKVTGKGDRRIVEAAALRLGVCLLLAFEFNLHDVNLVNLRIQSARDLHPLAFEPVHQVRTVEPERILS